MEKKIRPVFRLCEEKDLPAVMELDGEAFFDPWSRDTWQRELQNRIAVWIVAELENQIAGYAGIWNVAGEAQVMRVAVKKTMRNQGLGLLLTTELIHKAWDAGAEAVTLEVRESNIAAQTVYERCGFVSKGVRPDYYEDTHEKNGRDVLSNIISSQISIHRKYGGVVPEIASRKHIEHIMPVIDAALEDAKVTLDRIDGVAVTYGPGLVGALLVGLSAAKALAWATGKPLLGVNHLEGHVFANFINDKNLEPPFLALVVSGGHTALLKVTGYNSFEMLGQTRDDAAGEAFDKIARVMGLPYPGGPEIEKLALEGNPKAIDFPRAMLDDPFQFSFSGMKSSVINYLHNEEQARRPVNRADVAASFQEAVTDVLVQKSVLAIKATGLKEIVLAGGVSANKTLQHKLAAAAKKAGARLVHPTKILCTDNAVMIACRGYYMYQAGVISPWDLNAVPALKLGYKSSGE